MAIQNDRAIAVANDDNDRVVVAALEAFSNL